MENIKIFITRETQKRLISDIKDIIKYPLTEQGIYYTHCEDNMLKGYALLIGPSDTIYADGFYLFEFNFPCNYPFSPPVVKFMTTDGFTRFHPNLYRNGKVCLSILNTWKGEQWTSCQTIRSILLTLITLFHNKPLLNEPGFNEHSKDFIPYQKLIKYKNYKSALLGMASQRILPSKFIPFYIFIKKHFIKEYENIKKRLEEESKNKSEQITVRVYNMSCIPDYTKLLHELNIVYHKIQN